MRQRVWLWHTVLQSANRSWIRHRSANVTLPPSSPLHESNHFESAGLSAIVVVQSPPRLCSASCLFLEEPLVRSSGVDIYIHTVFLRWTSHGVIYMHPLTRERPNGCCPRSFAPCLPSRRRCRTGSCASWWTVTTGAGNNQIRTRPSSNPSGGTNTTPSRLPWPPSKEGVGLLLCSIASLCPYHQFEAPCCNICRYAKLYVHV